MRLQSVLVGGTLSHCSDCTNFTPFFRGELLDQIPEGGCAGLAEAEPNPLPVAHMLHGKGHNTGEIVQGQFCSRSPHGPNNRAEKFPLHREEILTSVGGFTAFSQTVKQISIND